MASGDHYEIIDEQNFAGQECLNVYVYQVSGGDVSAATVAEAYNTLLLPQIAGIQVAAVLHVATVVNNLEDLSDFINVATGVVGDQSGNGLPPFANYAMMYARTTRAVRNGQKRITGVPEPLQADGVLTTPGFTSLQTIALDLFGPVVSVDPALVMTPKIWRRPKGAAPQAFFSVGSIIARQEVSTQNTRKVGRGS